MDPTPAATSESRFASALTHLTTRPHQAARSAAAASTP
jgi:hypothetical protein